MIDDVLFALTLVSALGCGLMAGVFFAFSACAMNALARLSPAQGIAAKQSINIAVINPVFGVASGPATSPVGRPGTTCGRPRPLPRAASLTIAL